MQILFFLSTNSENKENVNLSMKMLSILPKRLTFYNPNQKNKNHYIKLITILKIWI